MRVQRGDTVHILAHRIPFVAWRAHRWSERKRVRLMDKLLREEQEGYTYTVSMRAHSIVSGLVHVQDSSGTLYSAHHSDLVRA